LETYQFLAYTVCFLVDWWLELVSLIYKMKKAPPPSVFAVVLLD
jgi:hypothetical protein